MLAPLAESRKPGPFVQMALDSLRRWPSFVAQLREDADDALLRIHGPGMLRVARTEMEADALCASLAWQQTLGLPLHRLSSAEVRAPGTECRAGRAQAPCCHRRSGTSSRVSCWRP